VLVRRRLLRLREIAESAGWMGRSLDCKEGADHSLPGVSTAFRRLGGSHVGPARPHPRQIVW
jgi:hypothetical protein